MTVLKIVVVLCFLQMIHSFPVAQESSLTWLINKLFSESPNNYETHVRKKTLPKKSVFVAPSLNIFEPCPKGYEEDERARCIKIVSFDEEKHSNFLLDKLGDFGDVAYDYDDEETTSTTTTTSKPFPRQIWSKEDWQPVRIEIPFYTEKTDLRTLKYQHENEEEEEEENEQDPVPRVETVISEKLP